MALLRYFKRIEPKKGKTIDTVLPKIDNSLVNNDATFSYTGCY